MPSSVRPSQASIRCAARRCASSRIANCSARRSNAAPRARRAADVERGAQGSRRRHARCFPCPRTRASRTSPFQTCLPSHCCGGRKVDCPRAGPWAGDCRRAKRHGGLAGRRCERHDGMYRRVPGRNKLIMRQTAVRAGKRQAFVGPLAVKGRVGKRRVDDMDHRVALVRKQRMPAAYPQTKKGGAAASQRTSVPW